DDSKTYDGLAYAGGNGVSYNGFVNGEDENVLSGSLTYTGSSQGAVNVGSYTITPAGYSSHNYAITYVDSNLTINKATLTYTATSITGPDSVIENKLDGTVSGFVPGDDLNNSTSGATTWTTTAEPGSAPGIYPITGGGLSSRN